MQISSRFPEYGITGAFFWIGQLLLLTNPQRIRTLADWTMSWTPLFESIPDAFHPLIVSLIGALAITAVFLAGLLLDLFGSYLIFWEIAVYVRHLSQNREWFSALIDAKAPHIVSEYRALERHFSGMLTLEEFLAGFSLFMPWSRKHRRRTSEAWKQVVGRYRLVRPYNRILNFLVSYVQVFSGATQLEILFDQVRLWRVGRAISTTLILLLFEWLLQLFPGSYLLAQVVIIILAIAVTLNSYSRLCFSLFALAYTTFLKNDPGLVPLRVPIVLPSAR